VIAARAHMGILGEVDIYGTTQFYEAKVTEAYAEANGMGPNTHLALRSRLGSCRG